MKKYIFKTVLFIGITTMLVSCKKDSLQNGGLTYKEPNLPETSYDYFNESGRVSRNPHVENDIATLGRVLFYEKQLSVNNSVSCGSCHVQSMGFADGRQFSPGFEFLNTPRNSPGIVNAGTMQSFFWDGRANGLENMVTMPVQNHLEMGIENFDYAVAKIKEIPYYKQLFEDAYVTDAVDKDKIAKALSQFIASIVTVNTKYDKGMTQRFANFNASELEGQRLFTALSCETCHNININGFGWSGQRFANIGLDTEYEDNGMYDPENPQRNNLVYKGMFKAPELRNIALTAPYMHDGRFATLEEVIEHYNSGIKDHPSLSWNFTNGNLIDHMNRLPVEFRREVDGNIGDVWRLNLTSFEKKALVDFLKTLTDNDVTKNPMYSDPFNY
jgi:cytochrome c peroxidase